MKLRPAVSTSLVGLLLVLAGAPHAGQSTGGAAGNPARSLPGIAADINGDGLSDSLSIGDTRIRVRLSRGPELSFGDVHGPIVGVAVADVDRDGDRDVMALSSRGNLHLWRNDGAGRFSHRKARPRGGNLQVSGTGAVSARRATNAPAVMGLRHLPPVVLARRWVMPLVPGELGPTVSPSGQTPLVLIRSSRSPPALVL